MSDVSPLLPAIDAGEPGAADQLLPGVYAFFLRRAGLNVLAILLRTRIKSGQPLELEGPT